MFGKKKQGNGLVFYEKKRFITAKRIYAVLSWAAVISGAVLFAYVAVYALGVRTTVIGDSMEPTLVNGQEIMINRLVYSIFEPGKGDVVVFKPNGNENAHTYVKRVVAVPGDTVRIKNGELFVNDEPTDFFSDNIADAGIAVNTGAAIAREIADITIEAEDLGELLVLRDISQALMRRIDGDYRMIITLNSMLILLGAFGIITPATSAMMHNLSTIVISLYNMTDLIEA